MGAGIHTNVGLAYPVSDPELQTSGGKHERRGDNDVCVDHRESNDGSRNIRHVRANANTVCLLLWSDQEGADGCLNEDE